MQLEIMKNKDDKKSGYLTRILVMGGVSILIGIISVLLLSNSIRWDVKSWLFTAGYSLMLGYGLFLNRFVASFIKNRWIHWVSHPVRSTLVAFVVASLYSTGIILFVNWFWFIFLVGYTWSDFLVFGKLILIIEYAALYIITIFFYAKSFFNDWRISLQAEEALKQEAVSLQYKVLSNQVNPHFLFNSLNVLSSLINLDKDRAQTFVGKLSNFYRDLLAVRSKEIVTLKEEVDFVNQYLDLQQERFGQNIVVNIQTDNLNNHQIIPMTLQMLVENAIKHNQINKENTLGIKIYLQNNYLIVENTFKPYLSPVEGEKLGLKNLSERYKFLTDRTLEVEKAQDKFIVKVPLLQMEDNLIRP